MQCICLRQETLAEHKSREEHATKSLRTIILRRIVVNLIVIAVLSLALFAVYSAVAAYASQSDLQ